jgi:rRNA-processing protein EBP2
MGKKKTKKVNTAAATAKAPKVTMEDLRAMSDDSDDDDSSSLPPEEEWDDDAKALKKAIQDGALDKVLEAYKTKAGDNDSVEEVELGDEDDEAEDQKLTAEQNVDDEASVSGEDSDSQAGEMGSISGDDYEDNDSEDSNNEPDDSKPRTVDTSKVRSDEESDRYAKSKDDSDDQDTDGSEEDQVEDISAKALRVVTEDIVKARNAMPWAETFTIVPPTSSPFAPGAEESLDIHDDLKREVAFYDIALEATLMGRQKCEEANIPFSRPEDFFAEMVKTDGTFCMCVSLSYDLSSSLTLTLHNYFSSLYTL